VPWRIVGLGAVVIVVFDGATAFLAETLGFEYAFGLIGSSLIYGGAGYAARRRGHGVRQCAAAAAAVAFVDATIGWALSAWIGPGRADDVGAIGIALTIAAVVIIGAFFGWIGAGLARRSFGRTG
jgi:hypothetical protein